MINADKPCVYNYGKFNKEIFMRLRETAFFVVRFKPHPVYRPVCLFF